MNHLKPEKYFFGLVALAIGFVGGTLTSAGLLVNLNQGDLSAQTYSSISSTTPRITLKSIQGSNYEYKTGDSVDIVWESANIQSNTVKIELFYNHNDKTYQSSGNTSMVDLIVGATPIRATSTIGTYRWKIPEYYARGVVTDSFLIRVSADGVVGYTSKFRIVSGTTNTNFSVTSPLGGKDFEAGATASIIWATSSTPNNPFSLSLLDKNDPSFLKIFFQSSGVRGNVSFKIPSDLKYSNGYYVRVNEGSYREYTGYSQNFTVFTSSTTTSLPVISFTASPTSIIAGQSVKFTWSVVKANSCVFLSPKSTQNVSVMGTKTVVIDPTEANPYNLPFIYTYTLNCTGAGGSASKNVVITISPKSVSATSTSILSVSQSIPVASSTSNKIDSTDGAKGVSIGSFAIKSLNGTSTITAMTLSLQTSVTSPVAVYLYAGSTMLDSRLITTNTSSTVLNFTNLKVSLAKDATKIFTVKVDMPASTVSGSSVVLNSNMIITYIKSDNKSVMYQTKVSPAHTLQYFFKAIPNFVFVSGTASSTKPSTATNTAEITGRFIFKVKPEGASMSAFASNGSNFVIATSTNGAPITASKIVTVTPNTSVYSEAVEYTVTLDIAIPKSSFKASQNIALYIKSIYWNMGTGVTQTWGLENFKTNTVTYLAQENNKNLIANVFYGIVDIINNVINKIGL